MNEPIELFTWAKLKEFCTTLTKEQLQQPVKLPRADESTIDIMHASELGDDHYYFPEHDYSCTKADYDKDCIDTEPACETFEEALEREEYYMTPGSTVYLFDE